MHSANRVPLAPYGIFLFLSWVLAASAASAQAPPEVAPPPKVIPGAGGPDAVPLRQFLMPIQATDRLQMTSGKPIKEVINQREVIVKANVMQTDLRTLVLQSERTPGNSRLTLTDVDGNTEQIEVVVQLRPPQIFDVDLLKRLIKQSVPTANVIPILGGGNSVILTGTVAYAEDIDVILRITENIVRAGPPDPIVSAALGGGAGGSGIQPDAFNTTTGVRTLTQLSIVNAMRIGGSQQVQLDVVVAQVSRSEFRQFGFSNLYSDKTSIMGNTVGGTIPLAGQTLGRASSTLNTNGVIQAMGGSSNLFVGLLDPNAGFFAFLQALRQENLAKLLAEPKLVTLSGRPANFISGGEQAVPTSQGLGGVGVTFIPFGTTLRFLPIVLGNGKIYMEVEPSVSNLNAANGVTLPGATTITPGRDVQTVRTSVLMEDGQTFAIGGLIQHTVQGSTSKLPFLGELPFVGVAFSQKVFTDTETELVVLVTPHLIDPMDCKQLPAKLPGMETRNPDDFELFLEGILEAPRGPREVWQNHRYIAAYKNDPTLHEYPCAGNAPPRFPPGAHGQVLSGGCGNGSCGCGGACGIVQSTSPPPGTMAMPVAAQHVTPACSVTTRTVLPAVSHTPASDASPTVLPAATPEPAPAAPPA